MLPSIIRWPHWGPVERVDRVLAQRVGHGPGERVGAQGAVRYRGLVGVVRPFARDGSSQAVISDRPPTRIQTRNPENFRLFRVSLVWKTQGHELA